MVLFRSFCSFRLFRSFRFDRFVSLFQVLVYDNKSLTERLLSLHHNYRLKDLLTVDLFSVYHLSRVDIVIHYI